MNGTSINSTSISSVIIFVPLVSNFDLVAECDVLFVVSSCLFGDVALVFEPNLVFDCDIVVFVFLSNVLSFDSGLLLFVLVVGLLSVLFIVRLVFLVPCLLSRVLHWIVLLLVVSDSLLVMSRYFRVV